MTKVSVLRYHPGKMCHCSNIYPRGKQVVDQECSTRCRSYTPCHDVQSCCGGPNAYSVSVVGDIDVAKQTLRRLANKWQTNVGYHNSMLRHVGLLYDADWRSSIDNGGIISFFFVQTALLEQFENQTTRTYSNLLEQVKFG